jgi:ADP-heptose:LPS heptosyltransferase
MNLTEIGITPVWTAGAAETALVAEVDPEHRWPSFAGQLDLTQLWQLLANARLLICPDTGVAHLGRIVGTPTLTLFGPGSTMLCGAGDFWRAVPYRALSIPIDCRNQHTNFQRAIEWIQRCERFPGSGAGECPRARCMDGIQLDAVWASAQAMLGFEK